jgi:hypothetical protein
LVLFDLKEKAFVSDVLITVGPAVGLIVDVKQRARSEPADEHFSIRDIELGDEMLCVVVTQGGTLTERTYERWSW